MSSLAYERVNCSVAGCSLRQQSTSLKRPAVELAAMFAALKCFDDLADLLEVTPYQLHYYTHRGQRYKRISIKKKHGGARILYAPNSSLMIVQRKLNQVLQAVYMPSSVVQGFTRDRSIVSNASLHVRTRYVLNIDLRDFFDSITFPRVRGMFMSKPYSQNASVATVLARICCRDGILPQGAPTSPVVSNMLLGRADSQLKAFARSHRCTYSRYADDLTFSTFVKSFPPALASFTQDVSGSNLVLGAGLAEIIAKNSFEVNPSKVRLQHTSGRQVVTGLTANRFPNVPVEFVRQTRAMLHAWEKFGTESAADEFFAKHDYQERKPKVGQGSRLFRQVVKGRIDFIGSVRGRDSRAHLSLLGKYASLNPAYKWPTSLPPREIKLNILEMGVFAVECESSQGTAFSCAGYGLVTCAHVVSGKGQLTVRQQGAVAQHAVKIVAADPDRDLALLCFASDAPPSTPKFDLALVEARKEDQVVLMGYPTAGPGLSSSLDRGAVTGAYTRFGQPRLSISCQILQGNSGGPVLDRNYTVVGVAANGKARVDKIGNQLYGVIPTATLLQFLESTKDLNV